MSWPEAIFGCFTVASMCGAFVFTVWVDRDRK